MMNLIILWSCLVSLFSLFSFVLLNKFMSSDVHRGGNGLPSVKFASLANAELHLTEQAGWFLI